LEKIAQPKKKPKISEPLTF